MYPIPPSLPDHPTPISPRPPTAPPLVPFCVAPLCLLQVLWHWDLVPHRVCVAAASFLDDVAPLPVLDVSLLSPGLLRAQPMLRNVRSLRHQLSYLRDLVSRLLWVVPGIFTRSARLTLLSPPPTLRCHCLDALTRPRCLGLVDCL